MTPFKIKFRNAEQKQFYWHKQRNGHFGGAFSNGKTFVGCQRAFTHMITFGNYGMVIARQKYKVLKATTMKTFFKICPKELIYKHDETDGYTVLINKSFIFWMHLDAVDEQDVRGLEPNSVLIDQGEEIEEGIANVLDTRVGRWDGAKVPIHLLLLKVEDLETREQIQAYINEKHKQDQIDELLFIHSAWPKDPFGERFKVPNYFDVLSNPSDEDELHWIWRQYNPASPEKLEDSFNIERKTHDELSDAGSIKRILSRDQEFIDKYYFGKTGSPKALIHKVHPLSEIKPSEYDKEVFIEFIKTLLRKAALFRVLDHGESGISCCIWEATYKNVHIFYREYYQPGKLISDHRQNIADLSKVGKDTFGIEEDYLGDYADPQIFKKTGQKSSGLFSVADEYCDEDELTGPPLYWQAADNNEYATRNRINELLTLNGKFSHPITGESPAPGIYFISFDLDIYPYGIKNALLQIKNQKRVLVGSINGKNIYTEERDDRIVDHAYDTVRYDIAMHNTIKLEEVKKPSKRSFAYFNALLKRNPEFVPASGNRS